MLFSSLVDTLGQLLISPGVTSISIAFFAQSGSARFKALSSRLMYLEILVSAGFPNQYIYTSVKNEWLFQLNLQLVTTMSCLLPSVIKIKILPSSAFANVPEQVINLFTIWNVEQPIGLPHI